MYFKTKQAEVKSLLVFNYIKFRIIRIRRQFVTNWYHGSISRENHAVNMPIKKKKSLGIQGF
jgi:hypothetical protein